MTGPDYNALNIRGFLKQKQEGFFVFRTRGLCGNYTKEQLLAIVEISKKYGNGIMHNTTRQGIEIPFIKFEDIENAEHDLQSAGILPGTSGSRIRATTCCPGNNWCPRGLVNTFKLFDRIENELNLKCGMDLPHKLKMAISGCPNICTRAQASDIGIHGQVDTSAKEKRIGYVVYLGGSGGRTPRTGIKLENVFSEEEALSIIKGVVSFYKDNAKPRQRLGLLIDEIGIEAFLKKIGL
ncbi:MAG: hypothetical protein HQ579_04830 [Candidatus Omnitrophica bacterium]|nr:hypothetical protein [Candidatus Omnitrophota bacterium]